MPWRGAREPGAARDPSPSGQAGPGRAGGRHQLLWLRPGPGRDVKAKAESRGSGESTDQMSRILAVTPAAEKICYYYGGHRSASQRGDRGACRSDGREMRELWERALKWSALLTWRAGIQFVLSLLYFILFPAPEFRSPGPALAPGESPAPPPCGRCFAFATLFRFVCPPLLPPPSQPSLFPL
ncbi:hypothetical protein MPTK1_3g13900 [Marchantia polymorpha subsp. ruderalis]|uniref:Uncharacterized protein n=2 Tax=Marchantia polymorpha TaxID=3197 RepID=A0AAF6B0J6_MARPO|nr:hypothetical protein MARPO_0004s0281 [Marchantia polymorpha]BBN05530.1 hypothetical protein Mp_3g13900 [Marchantia polymorpha subsp. ruderalis]|eukprot:PTQ49054.1 hypothetical protein MARPO_0004s0281 [Marchantia polymorpha]